MGEFEKIEREIAFRPIGLRVIFGLLFAGFTVGAFASSLIYWLSSFCCG